MTDGRPGDRRVQLRDAVTIFDVDGATWRVDPQHGDVYEAGVIGATWAAGPHRTTGPSYVTIPWARVAAIVGRDVHVVVAMDDDGEWYVVDPAVLTAEAAGARSQDAS